MLTKLVPIGNSMGVRLLKTLIEQYNLADGDIELTIEEKGILISSAKKARNGWEKQFADAIENGDMPEKDMFDGSQNDFDKTEWAW